MIEDNLFENILLEPFKRGADELCIVSGYSSAAMVFNHWLALQEIEPNLTDKLKINLIIGMTSRDGVSSPNHKAYNEFMNKRFKNNFFCSYIYQAPPVHSKLFTWLKNKKPVEAYMGSCNYSQQAFLTSKQLEIATKVNALDSYKYYNSLIDKSIYCNHLEAENLLNLYQYNPFKKELEEPLIKYSMSQNIHGLEHAVVSLLDRNGEVPMKSQLNWGQRENRERNQAYFQLSPEVYNSDFFPVKTIQFTVLTDDNKTLICTRAQKEGDGCAIQTPHNNSLLGEYMRMRLGVPNGKEILKSDLTKYGRTDIDFYKIDNETYYMDFSV